MKWFFNKGGQKNAGCLLGFKAQLVDGLLHFRDVEGLGFLPGGFTLLEVDVYVGHAGKRFQSLGYGLLAMVAGHAFHGESGHNRILSG